LLTLLWNVRHGGGDQKGGRSPIVGEAKLDNGKRSASHDKVK
jgi:hypothetical protein